MHGNPSGLTSLWVYQEEDGLCLPASVADVVAQAQGQGESATLFPQVTARAVQDGSLTRESGGGYSGMTMGSGVNLIREFGVTAVYSDSDSTSPMTAVEQALDGHQGVVVSVDADELPLWGETDPNDGTALDDGANHALVVIGVDEGAGLVYLNDSGHPSGSGETLTIAQFEDAWADSQYEMIVTS
jgi:hypothetical protein